MATKEQDNKERKMEPTLEQLKSRAYDLLAMQQQVLNELSEINKVIQERMMGGEEMEDDTKPKARRAKEAVT